VPAPAEGVQLIIGPEVVTPVGGGKPVVSAIGAAALVPVAFTDETTILNAVFAGNAGLNVTGDVVEFIVIGVPPATGYAIVL